MISPSLARTGVHERERGITFSLAGSWHRIVLFAIVALAAVLNFVGLSKEGYDNEYYAAAVCSIRSSGVRSAGSSHWPSSASCSRSGKRVRASGFWMSGNARWCFGVFGS
jgi:hypothetical protein